MNRPDDSHPAINVQSDSFAKSAHPNLKAIAAQFGTEPQALMLRDVLAFPLN